MQELGKSLQALHFSHQSQYSALPARDIKGSAREKLLDTSNTNTAEAHRTLAALKAIHEETYARLGVKQNKLDNFSFRLLQIPHSKIVPDDGIESFIALSYTWHSTSWKPHSSIAPLHQDANGPLTPAMWAALLAQLQEHECFWIDQLCIAQSFGSEKNAAIGSMDLVYQSARKVVVALEDIALSTIDADLMLKYASIESPSSKLSESEREEFAAAFWFDRAWCLHEFLVGRRHTFLVSIWHVDRPALSKASTTTIMRIDGPFLGHMYSMFIEQDIKHQNTAQESLLSEGQTWKNRQWIRVPSSGDQARLIGFLTIPRTTINAKVVRDGQELDMPFLGTNLALTSPSQHYLSIARWLIDHRALCEMSIYDQEMRLDT